MSKNLNPTQAACAAAIKAAIEGLHQRAREQELPFFTITVDGDGSIVGAESVLCSDHRAELRERGENRLANAHAYIQNAANLARTIGELSGTCDEDLAALQALTHKAMVLSLLRERGADEDTLQTLLETPAGSIDFEVQEFESKEEMDAAVERIQQEIAAAELNRKGKLDA